MLPINRAKSFRLDHTSAVASVMCILQVTISVSSDGYCIVYWMQRLPRTNGVMQTEVCADALRIVYIRYAVMLELSKRKSSHAICQLVSYYLRAYTQYEVQQLGIY